MLRIATVMLMLAGIVFGVYMWVQYQHLKEDCHHGVMAKTVDGYRCIQGERE